MTTPKLNCLTPCHATLAAKDFCAMTTYPVPFRWLAVYCDVFSVPTSWLFVLFSCLSISISTVRVPFGIAFVHIGWHCVPCCALSAICYYATVSFRCLVAPFGFGVALIGINPVLHGLG